MLKQDILNAAIRLAQVKGYRHVTREEVAEAAGCAESTISYHFDTMSAFRDAIVSHAIETEALGVVADALSARSPVALAVPEGLRRRAIKHLADSLR